MLTHTKEQILADYKESPSSYMQELPDSIESAESLLCLINAYPEDQSLADLITEFCLLSPEYIMDANASLELRIKLLNIAYLSGEFGTMDIAIYYKDIYRMHSKTNFDLNAHSILLEKLIYRMLHINEYYTNISFKEEFLNLEYVIRDLANNTSLLKKPILAAIMPIYHILTNIDEYMSLENTGEYSSFESIVQSLATIIHHLYGDRIDELAKIANTLEVTKNPDFWIANLNSKEYEYDINSLLPTL